MSRRPRILTPDSTPVQHLREPDTAKWDLTTRICNRTVGQAAGMLSLQVPPLHVAPHALGSVARLDGTAQRTEVPPWTFAIACVALDEEKIR